MEIKHYNTWLPCVNVDVKNNTALVRSHRTGKCFPVTLNKDIKYLVSRGDRLHVVKSHVSGEWLAIDYNAMTAITSGDYDE
jgi:hypothetical protein